MLSFYTRYAAWLSWLAIFAVWLLRNIDRDVQQCTKPSSGGAAQEWGRTKTN